MTGFMRRIGLVVIAAFLSFAVAVVAPVQSAQAAVNASPWLRSAGTALSDEFDTIIAHGGLGNIKGGFSGVTGFHGAASGASGTLGALAGGIELGIVLGTAGLKLAGKIHSGDWDEYTKNVDCNEAGQSMVALGNTGMGLLGFGDQYSCRAKIHTDDLSRVSLDDVTVDKDPVPDPPAPAYRIDYTREYQIKGGTPQCNVTFPVQIHFTGYDKDGFIADVTNSNSFPISSAPNSQTICAFGVQMYGYAVYFDGNGSTQLSYAGARTIASGETVHDLKFGIKSVMSGFPDSSAGKKVQCIGSDYKDGYSLKNCLGVTPQGTSVSTKGDNDTTERQISCRVTATDGTHIDAPGDTYSDSNGLPLDSETWGCNKAWQQTINAGKVPQRVTATSTFPGVVGDPQVLFNQPVTSDAQSQIVQSPKCASAAGNDQGCVYRLLKRIGGQLRSCSDADVWDSCADWATEVQNDANAYQCRYGESKVSIDKCAMYEPTFKAAYGGKLTYKDKNDEDVSIDPDSGTMAQPDTKSCWAGVISWNPLDWVLTPIKCSFIWAFLPTDTDFGSVSRAWDNTPPGVAISAVRAGVIDNPDLGDQCSGPHVLINQRVFGQVLHADSYPLSSCDHPMSDIAATCRVILSCLIITAAAYASVRNLASVVHAPPLGGAQTT